MCRTPRKRGRTMVVDGQAHTLRLNGARDARIEYDRLCFIFSRCWRETRGRFTRFPELRGVIWFLHAKYEKSSEVT